MSAIQLADEWIVDGNGDRPAEGLSREDDVRADYNRRVQELALLPEIEYDRIRKAEAKQLGVRTTTLDRAVQRLRGNVTG